MAQAHFVAITLDHLCEKKVTFAVRSNNSVSAMIFPMQDRVPWPNGRQLNF